MHFLRAIDILVRIRRYGTGSISGFAGYRIRLQVLTGKFKLDFVKSIHNFVFFRKFSMIYADISEEIH